MTTPLLEVTNVSKRFPIGQPPGRIAKLIGTAKPQVELHAVDDVSFTVGHGETVGLVGESGCGKSTLVRLLARLIDPTAGTIRFEGKDISDFPAESFARRPERTRLQMVFQDPTDSLNPRFTAFDAIAEPLRRLGTAEQKARLAQEVSTAADNVGLPQALLTRYPHQLSGGQKARVGIARAIALKPKLLLLDEPTSALDVSVQATVLRLLAELKTRLDMSYVFVSHDLNVVRLLCDRVIVMYLGKVVESGPASGVFLHPGHPYAKALISAIPTTDPELKARRIRLQGEPRSPIAPSPHVCRFYGRCPQGVDLCKEQMPALNEVSTAHRAACHFAKVA
jgi:oligopeptide/dipeptide ABC transporter ATP-binding protein